MVKKTQEEAVAINNYLEAFDKVVEAHLEAMGLPDCFDGVCKAEAEKHGAMAGQCLFLTFLSIHLYACVRGKVQDHGGEEAVITVINNAIEAGHMFWGEGLQQALARDIGEPIHQADTSKVN